MWTQQIKVLKITDKQYRKQNDILAIEKEIDLFINQKKVTTFHCYPGKEKELAAGYIACNGITNPNTVTSLAIHEEGVVCIHENPTYEAPSIIPKKIEWSCVLRLTAYLQEKALLFKDTSVTESAALASEEDLITFSEDLHIENAVFKAIGERYKTTDTLENDILLVSSKVDTRLILYMKNTGLSIVVSRTAPTSKALALATKLNICVIGFARGKKFTVYNLPHTVTLPV